MMLCVPSQAATGATVRDNQAVKAQKDKKGKEEEIPEEGQQAQEEEAGIELVAHNPLYAS